MGQNCPKDHWLLGHIFPIGHVLGALGTGIEGEKPGIEEVVVGTGTDSGAVGLVLDVCETPLIIMLFLPKLTVPPITIEPPSNTLKKIFHCSRYSIQFKREDYDFIVTYLIGDSTH